MTTLKSSVAFAALALIYVVFPSPLMSMEAQVTSIEIDRVESRRREETGERVPRGQDDGLPPAADHPLGDWTEGYVFGRSMAPGTVYVYSVFCTG